MTADHAITVGVFEGFSWIRCEGKGSFMNSPLVKSFAEERIGLGEQVVVVDLSGCSGMDSTFMGTLAGMASKLSAAGGGVLQIAEAGERNRRALEDLGLDFLMQIDPPEAAWHARLEAIRLQLRPVHAAQPMAQSHRARHVLQAHEVLSEVNQKNAREFANVVGMLREQLTKGPAGQS